MKNENEKRLRDDFVFVINARFTNAYLLTTNTIHGQVVRVVMTMVILEMIPCATDLSRCKKSRTAQIYRWKPWRQCRRLTWNNGSISEI